jgi:signal transduction histidine kinase
MSPETSTSRLDSLLFRSRKPLVVLAFLYILYCLLYLWFFVPYEDFTYQWGPDSQLVVRVVPVESLARSRLEPGDRVLAIDGNPIRRMRPIYPLPIPHFYEYEIEREGQVLSTTVSFSPQITPLAIRLRLPATVLSLAGLLVGTLILLLAAANNGPALHAGHIFILGSVVIISIQASLNGVPGTWIAGYSLVFVLAPAWVYLGFIPRTMPLSRRSRRLLKLSTVVAALLALAAIFEVLYLYSQPTSFQELIGFSIYSSGLFFMGVALLTSVLILAWRCLTLPSSSYLRQQLLILLTFFGLGILPTVLLTLVPATLLKVVLLPFELAITLMLLIPAGYLFVIYRKGFLGLDLFFSRALHLTILSLIVFGFYAATLYLAQQMLNQNSREAVTVASFVFLPTFLLAVYVNKPLRDFTDRLVYGDVAYSQVALADYTNALSSYPERSTLAKIVGSLAKTLSSTRASLILQDEGGHPTPVGIVGIDAPIPPIPTQWQEIRRPVLRSAANDRKDWAELFQTFSWAEILVPVRVRDEQIGILILSRPGPDGFFNGKQVSFLIQAAGVLAVAAENIFLLNTARRQARRMMFIQEEERRILSRQLHDDPLQRVTYAINVIDQILLKRESGDENEEPRWENDVEARLETAVEHLRQAASALRSVCVGLHPPFHDVGVELVIREIVRQFVDEYGLNIHLNIQGHGLGTDISEEVAVVIGRILTEALNNVLKHASSADTYVVLRFDQEMGVRLTVTDNGPGSPVLELPYTELIRRGHLGIIGMYEWAQQVEGELTIIPNVPQGTKVEFGWMP